MTVYRLYLCSSFGRVQNGNVYDVIFSNINLPPGAKEYDGDKWYVFVESVMTLMTTKDGGSTPLPYALVTDLSIANAYTNTNNSVPLAVIEGGEDIQTREVNTSAVGHLLTSSPSRLFQGGQLRVRITKLDGTTMANDESQVWSVTLVIYKSVSAS